jgi:uncharacterized protein (DUF433 family)
MARRPVSPAAAQESELVDRHIERDPYHHGESWARLRDYGVSVWILVAYAEAYGGDLTRVAHDYDVPLEAVEAALAYYRRHKAAIDVRIREQLAAFT